MGIKTFYFNTFWMKIYIYRVDKEKTQYFFYTFSNGVTHLNRPGQSYLCWTRTGQTKIRSTTQETCRNFFFHIYHIWRNFQITETILSTLNDVIYTGKNMNPILGTFATTAHYIYIWLWCSFSHEFDEMFCFQVNLGLKKKFRDSYSLHL